MNKLLNNLLGMYKQAKMNKKAESYKSKVAEMLNDINDPNPLIDYISESDAKKICEELDIPHEASWYKGDLRGYVDEIPDGMVDVLIEYISEDDAESLWRMIANDMGMDVDAKKQTKMSKKAEEKESAKKDYTEQYAKVKEIMKEYGYGLSDGGYIYLISKEQPKDEGFQVKFKGDRLRVELDGKLTYSGYGPEAIEDFLKGMFYAKKLSSKNTKLTKKQAEEKLIEVDELQEIARNLLPIEDIGHDGHHLLLKKGPKSTEIINKYEGKDQVYTITNYKGIEGNEWYDIPFAYAAPFMELYSSTKKQAEEKLYVAKLYDNKGLKNDNLGKSKSVEELKDLLRDFLFEKRKIRETNPYNNSFYLRDKIVIEDYYTGEPIETIKVSDLLSTYGKDYWKPFMNTEATKKQATIVEKYKNDFSGYTDTYQLETIEKNLNQYDIDDIKSELSEAKRFVSKMDKLKRMPHKDVENYYYMKDKALIAEKLIEEKTKNKMGKSATIKHENGEYNVYSESGKCLGKGYKTKEEAEKRLKQVEYFKHKDKKAAIGYDFYGPKIMPDEAEGTFRIKYYGGPGKIDYLRKSKNGKYHWVEQTHFDYNNDKPFETTDYELAKKLVDQFGGEIETVANKQTKNKRTSLKQVVISKMAGNYYTNKKEELLNIAKDYKVGIADGQIMSPERAVNALINHTNIGYIQFSNDEELLRYDSLTDAIYEGGIDYELSDKYYID